MTVQIKNTSSVDFKPSTVMLLYGEGGVGKTTFATTAPKPLLVDCEGGTKYLGLRNISVDVVQVQKWADMGDVLKIVQSGNYETIVIDPIGELMEKLKQRLIEGQDTKLVQKDGSPTMAGWGWLKSTMRKYIKTLRDSGLNVLIIAHLQEVQDEERMIKRPKVETKLSSELVDIVDIVGYMTVVEKDGEEKRVIICDPGSDKYTAKDRTSLLPKYIQPDFQYIVNLTQEALAKLSERQNAPLSNETTQPSTTAAPAPQSAATATQPAPAQPTAPDPAPESVSDAPENPFQGRSEEDIDQVLNQANQK